jgi:serine/threonine protein phosphatase Stp1
MTRFRSSAATDPGGRAYNEDAALDRPDLGLWAVADGAGGHAFGAAASAAVVAALETIPPRLTAAEMLAQVRLRLASVHAALLTAAAAQGEGCVMASTVVVLIARGAHFACLWAGDSRVYRLRDGTLDQLTHDHSLVQELVDEGRLTEAAADTHPQRNVITRAIGGGEAALSLDKMTGRLRAGDRFLLCSDGVCKTLPAAELAELVSAGVPAGPLVAAVLGRSPSDNVTAVVVEVARSQDG